MIRPRDHGRSLAVLRAAASRCQPEVFGARDTVLLHGTFVSVVMADGGRTRVEFSGRHRRGTALSLARQIAAENAGIQVRTVC